MSQFSGPQYKGAMADRRRQKRNEAEARDRQSQHGVTGRRGRDGELDRTIYDTFRGDSGAVLFVSRRRFPLRRKAVA